MLLAWRKGGASLREEEFLEPLGLRAGDGRTGRQMKVRIGTVEEPSIDDAVEAAVELERLLANCFLQSSAWLASRAPSAFAGMRERGIHLELLVDYQMDDDQMEFTLPPELLLALGERGLSCHIISND
jgi:hypothetical protein